MTQPEGISGLFHGIRLLATRTGFILERPESAQLRRPRPRSVMSASRQFATFNRSNDLPLWVELRPPAHPFVQR